MRIFINLALCLIVDESLFAGDIRNFQYNISSSCANSTYENCYSLSYENTDGSKNVFCNYIAWLNIFSPFINYTSIYANGYYQRNWDKMIDEEINEQLNKIKIAEKEVRQLLARVITNFKNGIGEGFDSELASSTVERLNDDSCKSCIEKFVSIVSRSLDGKEAKRNRTEFKNFVVNRRQACQDAQHEKIAYPCPLKPDDVSWASCNDWTSAFHPSTILYALATFALPWPLSFIVNTNNHAGALVGDVANFTNSLTILSVGAFSVWQKYMNYDDIMAKRLAEETKKRLDSIHGIVEIAGKILGTMDNGINENETRGFIRALILIGWPKNLVDAFENLAQQDDHSSNYENLGKAIFSQLKEKNIIYRDVDINSALEKSLSIIVD